MPRTVGESRRRTLPPPDDVLGCRREAIPPLGRGALHRCPARHGVSRLPEGEGKASRRKRFAETRIGCVHVDACQPRPAEGEVHLFLAIDRDPPPLKWSALRYGFGPEEDRDDEQAAQA